jgi:hypothetical protein
MCKNFTTWLNEQLYTNDGQFVSFYNHAAKLQKLQQMANKWTITANTYITIICLEEKHVQSYDCAVTSMESDPKEQLLHNAWKP